MYYKTFIFCLLFILLCIPNLYPQYNNKISSDSPPWITSSGNGYPKSILYNPYSLAYAYVLEGISSQFFKFNVGNPGLLTPIGNPVADSTFGSGGFANPTGVWKYYVQNQRSPFVIYEVDTSSGAITFVGIPTNFKNGHKPKVMTWDYTTNTMYVVSQNSAQTETQFYSMYWPTKELTWIGPSVSIPSQIWSGAFNANGNFFGIDNSTDALWKVNKYTGEWTEVGPLGYSANYYQAAGFDKSKYAKMLWCGWGSIAGIFEVDTASGSATLIGPFEGDTITISVDFVPYYGPQISHTPLPNTSNLTGPYVVNAVITTSGSGISTTKLYWSRNNTAITDSLIMTNTSGNNWTGNIPGNGLNATYRYYIWTKDSLERTATAPYDAPGNLYSFITVSDTMKPVISHTPLGNMSILNWPDFVVASVTDNYGIDSVWVNWRINNTGMRHFKLFNSTGNNYLAKFNSTYSDVVVGDTIYYRIFAQDNSPVHNKDSTVIWSFCLDSALDLRCVGNGNEILSASSPFNTFWKSFKTQMLYTSNEILSNGGYEGFINKIAFYVLHADTLTMNGFNIKMQNTTISILNNGFINVDWTVVYSGSYKVQSTGWQYIILQDPFYWDGASNLLIDICFGNSNRSNSSYVQGTSAQSMYYYGFRDDSLACSINPNTASGESAKPNICFGIENIIGVNSRNNHIPTVYNLFQNYPNPFNPVTKINYEIPKQGYVSLRIYDILGREIKKLVNEVKSVGSYSVDYNASGLPSGVYLYRLECNGYVNTKRMILLK